MRRFVAITLPEEIQDELSLLDDDLPAARWSRPEQLHLTLRFVGDMPQGDRRLRDALRAIEFDPFELAVAGVGVFPGRGPPRVVWAGLDRSAHLFELQRRVERVAREVGIVAERRRFRPHVTLARIGRGVADDDVTRFILRHTLLRLPRFEVRSFSLMGSTLHPDGARHREIQRYASRSSPP